MVRLLALIFLLRAVVPSSASSNEGVGSCSSGDLTITTSTSTVTGIINGTAPNVRQWLGIPYAKPPVGNLRWSVPVPLPKSNKGLSAGFLPNACMQATGSGGGIYGSETGYQFLISTPVSEDCLTLSVWAPANTRRNLPVVIFIHGGGLTGGGESVQYQIPANWVQRTQSHIVVSIQYRLGVFGFPNSHALADMPSQNFGLLDQRLAIEWVRDNIAAFGGNPHQITLWGQSAGAASIDWYNFAYPKDPIAKGFIMDSGSVWLPFGRAANITEVSFATMASQFNCTGSNMAQLACLKNQSAAAIQSFISSPQGSNLSFPPTQDNVTVFSNYTVLYQKKHFADIPVIYGTNLNEPPTTFMCPEAQDLRQRAPTSRLAFFYQYHGNFSNISPDPTVGAYHSSELPLIMGTYGNVHGPGTRFESTTSKTMQDLWLAFAEDPYKGLPKKGWRPFNDGYAQILGDTVGEIASRSVHISEVTNWSTCPTDNQYFLVSGTSIK